MLVFHFIINTFTSSGAGDINAPDKEESEIPDDQEASVGLFTALKH